MDDGPRCSVQNPAPLLDVHTTSKGSMIPCLSHGEVISGLKVGVEWRTWSDKGSQAEQQHEEG